MRRKPSPVVEAAAESPAERVCVCVNLRRATRVVSQFYDEALAPTGLKITQFSLMRSIERLEPASIGALAAEQELDRTTLARNLAPLERDGLVVQAAGSDKRVSEVRLTPAGRQVLADAMPLWKSAQAQIARQLGRDTVAQLRTISDSTARLLAKRSG